MSHANEETSSGASGSSLDFALQGMKRIEHDAEREFQEHQKVLTATQAPFTKTFAPLIDQLRNDPRAAESRDDLRKLFSTFRERELKPPIIPRLHVLSSHAAGAQIAPQFNWTWDNLSGTGSATVQSNASNKSMSSDTGAGAGSGAAEARAGLGIFFSPADVSQAPNGVLNISGTPAFSFFWVDAAQFSWAATSAWIGLLVRKFDLNGNDAGTPVDQRLSLWNDSISFAGSNSNQGSTTGFPLSAQISVDTDHQYNIWVWCSTQCSSGDASFISTGDALGQLNVTVPSISIALFS